MAAVAGLPPAQAADPSPQKNPEKNSETIQRAREAALAILKPTAKQLEHGLELHADTTCDGLHHHIRSKPDRVIKAIADTGGYIGICCVPAFLGGQGNIGAMLDHLDYAVRRFGAEHVAIGIDVAYTSRNMAVESKKVPRTGPTRPRWESFWPPGSLDSGGQPLSLAWTNWPLFTVGMVQRGYSDDDIQKILGGNVMRVAKAALIPSN